MDAVLMTSTAFAFEVEHAWVPLLTYSIVSVCASYNIKITFNRRLNVGDCSNLKTTISIQYKKSQLLLKALAFKELLFRRRGDNFPAPKY